ncbi:MAG: tRNA 4-thiouridine(8) synthase ThiI [Firmicutes bacterium]|nr:tRNA 4-thiouridine(8) synthase ThiI [Bacillota bacterium]
MKTETQKVIILREGEIFLKGKNRGSFEKILKQNIVYALKSFKCNLIVERNRFVIIDFLDSDTNALISKLSKIFGISSVSIGVKVPSIMEDIENATRELIPQSGTFRVTVNRGDKKFQLNTMELSRHLGGVALEHNPNLTVDLHTPQFTLNVDVREEGSTYLFKDKIKAVGGMPIGSAGEGLLLLSGGIDSPVAGYYMLKRGLKLTALHFHSYPFTSIEAQKKVERLKAVLEDYGGRIKLLLVPFTKLQEAIRDNCSESYGITLLRCSMMRIAERVAKQNKLSCIINGESLGQVASQTIESITATESVVKDIPILRPLIGLDKQEIIEVAKRIESFDISIEPFEDCCTVFTPEKPVIKPKLDECIFQESRIENLEQLLNEAFEGIEII